MSLIREKLPPSEPDRVSIVDNPFVILGRFWGDAREADGSPVSVIIIWGKEDGDAADRYEFRYGREFR